MHIKWSYFSLRFFSNYFETGQGFHLEYAPLTETQWSYNNGSCGGHFSTPNGILTSPLYPESYQGDTECIYTISQPIDNIILMSFHSFDVASYSWDYFCAYKDYLEIRDGLSGTSSLLGKMCGNKIPDPIQSSQNHLWLK